MSEKLYNGLILRNYTLEQSIRLLHSVRKVCLSRLQNAVVAKIAEIYVFRADLPINFHQFRRKPLKDYYNKFDDLIREAGVKEVGDIGRNDWDYTFSLRLIPKGQDLLALYYIWNDPGYIAALTDVGFEDYHYQNQTDPPDHIPEEEWLQRDKDWHKYYYGDWVDDEPGFVYPVIEWIDIQRCNIEEALVRDAVPTEKFRRNNIASFLVSCEKDIMDELIKNNLASQQEYDDDSWMWWYETLPKKAAEREAYIQLEKNIKSLQLKFSNAYRPSLWGDLYPTYIMPAGRLSNWGRRFKLLT